MSDKVWYVAVGGQQQGPFSLHELYPRFQSGELRRDTFVFTAGMANWAAAGERPELAAAFAPPAAVAPPAYAPPAPQAYAQAPPAQGYGQAPQPAYAAQAPQAGYAPSAQQAFEIDYEVFGEEMQFVEITLDRGEACVAEAGSFMFMEPGIQMETIFGDGSKQQGGGGGGFMGALLSGAKRVLTGESLFMTSFTNQAPQRQKVAFASPYPGKIIPVDLRAHGRFLLCQKDAFLCAARGISVGIAFQRKLGAGLFGGEGFILQKLEGDGLAFLHAGGTVVKRTLQAGETLRIDTGCIVAFEQQCNYDIQMVKGVKSAIFGGEGLFFATLTGPGNIWLQSLPFSRLADRILMAAGPGGRKEEGSVLGGLGNLLDGD